MFKIQTLNNISSAGLNCFSHDLYEVASEIQHPDAILLRSYNMHEMPIPASLKAVARAGAGVNNIPVNKLSDSGVPVFNAAGANANAVNELVLTGMLLAYRNIAKALEFVQQVKGDNHAIEEQIEKGKKQFVGHELAGRTLGVIGLGAIGVKVANAALALDMKVIGFDPAITVQRAWELSSGVRKAANVDEVFSQSDMITIHVPLMENTRDLVNASRLQIMKKDAVLLNFSRQGVVNEDALINALNEGQLFGYVCDFPTRQTIDHPKVIALPHLGASTHEAEEKCAVMVIDYLRDYLENGNIRGSVISLK